MNMRRVRGFTVIEVVVAFAIFGLLLALAYGLLSNATRSESKLSRIERAVAHAEIALASMSCELRSLMPPDPLTDRVGYRLLENGHGITFLKLEEAGAALAATVVTYELRPVGTHGNFQLYRNGTRLAGVLLRDLTISQQELAEVDDADGNPVLRVKVTGIAEDADPVTLGPTGVHTVELDLPVPATSPEAVRGLPPVARELIESAVKFRGVIPGSAVPAD